MRLEDKYKPIYSEKRFFLNSVLGCPNQCVFCYIYNYGLTNNPVINPLSINEQIDLIIKHKDYIHGKSGSIIALGSWGDPFYNSKARETTISWLSELTKLGNPIQISTKFYLTEKDIETISSALQYDNQLLFSTSIASISRWKDIDRFAPPPLKRLETLHKLKQEGVATNVLIKPFLPGVTDNDIDIFCALFSKYDIPNCVVGIFYWNEFIIKQLKKAKLFAGELKSCMEYSNFANNLVCTPNLDEHFSFDGNLSDKFCNTLRSIGVNVFKNTVCVTAWLLNVPHINDLRYKDSYNLCVRCGNCKQLSNKQEI